MELRDGGWGCPPVLCYTGLSVLLVTEHWSQCEPFQGLLEIGLVERTGVMVVEMVGWNNSLWIHAKPSQICLLRS